VHNEPLRQLVAILQEHLANNATEIVIDHDTVSVAFPKSHPFDDRMVNWNTLRVWAKSEGWDVRALTEETPAEDQHRPYILFSKSCRHKGNDDE
ncbi:MAG: hypothetical protein PHU01_10420, partial [Desulfuromonadaceae bacterium]|nr:hypothetical protein [Desulfuromonadaceae bacterium]